MSVSPEGLQSFKSLYQQQFDEELTEEDLDRKTRLLLNLYIAVYKSPIELIREDTLTNQDT